MNVLNSQFKFLKDCGENPSYLYQDKRTVKSRTTKCTQRLHVQIKGQSIFDMNYLGDAGRFKTLATITNKSSVVKVHLQRFKIFHNFVLINPFWGLGTMLNWDKLRVQWKIIMYSSGLPDGQNAIFFNANLFKRFLFTRNCFKQKTHVKNKF